MGKYALIILLLFLNNTCTKKKIDATPKKERPTFECDTIHKKDYINTGWNYSVNKKTYTNPHFNPSNGFEFVFMKKDYNSSFNEIYVYNLITKTKKLVYKGLTHSHLEWTTNNWIIFNNGVLQKIKPNGCGLEEITKIKHYFTTYNDNILYKKKGDNKTLYISDLKGNIDKSINNLHVKNRITWLKNQIAYVDKYDKYLKVYNLQNKNIKSLCQNYDLSSISGVKWINDIDFVWADLERIYKTNSNTNRTDTIMTHCNGYKYQFFDYSFQLDKLICHRVTQKVIDDNLIKVDIYIVMMNTDGTEKEIIDIDNEFKGK